MTIKLGDPKTASWQAFLRTYATVMRQLEREMEEEQALPLTWYDILAFLDRAPKCRMRMQDLAESVLLSRSGLTRLLDRMADEGLVDRVPCEEDRRGTYAVITDAGRARLTSAVPGHLQGIEEHFLRHLEPGDLKVLGDVLNKVIEGELVGPEGDTC